MAKGRKQRQRDKAGSSSVPAKNQQSVLRKVSQQVSATTSFSGPIPPPEILINYNNAVPDGAERILVMAEKQNEHRMELEAKVVFADIVRSYLGVGAGLVVAVLFGVLAYLLIDGGHEAAGISLGTGTLASIVGTFVYGTISRRRERRERFELMAGQGE